MCTCVLYCVYQLLPACKDLIFNSLNVLAANVWVSSILYLIADFFRLSEQPPVTEMWQNAQVHILTLLRFEIRWR